MANWNLIAPQIGTTTRINWFLIDSGKLFAGTGLNAELLEFDGTSLWIVRTSSLLGGASDVITIAKWVSAGSIVGSTVSRVDEWDGISDWQGTAPTVGFKGEFLDAGTTIVFAANVGARRFVRTDTNFSTIFVSAQLPGSEQFLLSFEKSGTLYGLSDSGFIYSWDGIDSSVNSPIQETFIAVANNARNFVHFGSKIFFIFDDGKLWSWDFSSVAMVQEAITFGTETDMRGMAVHSNEIYASTGNGFLLRWDKISAWIGEITTNPGFGINSIISFNGLIHAGDDTNGALYAFGTVADPENFNCWTPISITKKGFIIEEGESLPNSFQLATKGYICKPIEDISVITDYCDRAIDRLAEQFKENTDFKHLICTITDEIQEIEFVLQDLLIFRTLNNAIGFQLDVIGEIVGLSRQGLMDNEYRDAIKFQIFINVSSGEPETLITYTEFLTQATLVSLNELYPATVLLETNGVNISTTIGKQIEIAAAAGVEVEITGSQGITPVFTLAPDIGTMPIPNSAGFSEPGISGSGGHLSERFN